MTRFSGKVLFCGATLLLAAAASAQISKQSNGYLFRMKFTKGQKISYVMNMSGSMQGQKFTANMPMTQTVVAVSNGVGTLKFDVGDMKMTINGQPMNQQMPAGSKSSQIKMDSRGKPVGSTGPQQTSVALPEKPIPVGGTWTATTDAPVMGGQSMKVSATYKFTGIEKVGGFNAAKIAVTMKGTGQMALTGTGTLWLNLADGTMIKNSNAIQMNMNGQQMPMTMSITRK